MIQTERRLFLINKLLEEQPEYAEIQIPASEQRQKQLLRSLMNVRQPKPIMPEVLRVQDGYLQAETAAKGITELSELSPVREGIYLWKGDITTLHCDAIVNAANSGMTGCYCPCHGCIDNCIHTFAGMQLRLKCAEIMRHQGHPEPTGQAKVTSGYNLPCRYVIHTVGPIVQGDLTPEHEQLLISCYRSCLQAAQELHLTSIAFCCISTGEFHFPNRRAAELAIQTVRAYKQQTGIEMKVIFNVFKQSDYDIYNELLGAD